MWSAAPIRLENAHVTCARHRYSKRLLGETRCVVALHKVTGASPAGSTKQTCQPAPCCKLQLAQCVTDVTQVCQVSHSAELSPHPPFQDGSSALRVCLSVSSWYRFGLIQPDQELLLNSCPRLLLLLLECSVCYRVTVCWLLVTNCKTFQTTTGMTLLCAHHAECPTSASYYQALLVKSSLMHQWQYCRVLQKSSGGGVALSSLEKKKPIVLFFYPKVCTVPKTLCCLESCALSWLTDAAYSICWHKIPFILH